MEMGIDFKNFQKKLETVDAQRTNTFFVVLPNFLNAVSHDGVIDFDSPVESGEEGSSNEGGFSFDYGRIGDELKNSILKNSPDFVKKIIGAYDPGLVRTIFGDILPDIFIPGGYDINRDLAITAKGATIPGRRFNTTVNWIKKTPFHQINSSETDPVRIEFYSTTGMPERMLIESWMKTIYDPKRQVTGFRDSYCGELQIYICDRKGRPRSFVNLERAFPIEISETQLDFESNNEIAKFTVSFQYSNMSHVEVNPEDYRTTDDTVDDILGLGNRVGNNPAFPF